MIAIELRKKPKMSQDFKIIAFDLSSRCLENRNIQECI